MTDGVRRRTWLLAGGGLAAVLAGGVVAVSQTRKERVVPRGGVTQAELDNLPVVEVPAPTVRPVEVVYCAGWDAVARVPVSPMSESVARAQDEAGAQYAVVAYVGGVARLVAEVCWSAHHAELWNVDEDGRRYRGAAYRRWPDGRLRLFEVRSWNYAAPDVQEFDDEEVRLRARIRRDAKAAIQDVEIEATLAERGTLATTREWSDWPERTRPHENVTVPGVSGWPGLAGMTGPVTVRPGPDVVPDEFPWRAPRPLSPRHVTEMVTEGRRFTKPDGAVLTIERVDAGRVRLPSGRMVVGDPGWLDTDSVPLAEKVPPGTYPVEVFRVRESGQVAACRVTVTGDPVTSWHLALLDGDHELALGDGEFSGAPVDTAMLSIVDATGRAAYPQEKIEEVMENVAVLTHSTVSDRRTGTDVVVVRGWTDGAYPTWLGRTADGTIACVVLDMMEQDLATATPA